MSQTCNGCPNCKGRPWGGFLGGSERCRGCGSKSYRQAGTRHA